MDSKLSRLYDLLMELEYYEGDLEYIELKYGSSEDEYYKNQILSLKTYIEKTTEEIYNIINK